MQQFILRTSLKILQLLTVCDEDTDGNRQTRSSSESPPDITEVPDVISTCVGKSEFDEMTAEAKSGLLTAGSGIDVDVGFLLIC